MAGARVILEPERFALTLERLARQLEERYGDFADVALVGIQPRGTLLAERLHGRLASRHPDLPLGRLDITFFRDDVGRTQRHLRPDPMDMPFDTEGRDVVLVDDVLYTGRTINAALQALQSFGRPASVELVVMVDRRFRRQLPIRADYQGVAVDALDAAYVAVRWADVDGRDEVILFPDKPSATS